MRASFLDCGPVQPALVIAVARRSRRTCNSDPAGYFFEWGRARSRWSVRLLGRVLCVSFSCVPEAAARACAPIKARACAPIKAHEAGVHQPGIYSWHLQRQRSVRIKPGVAALAQYICRHHYLPNPSPLCGWWPVQVRALAHLGHEVLVIAGAPAAHTRAGDASGACCLLEVPFCLLQQASASQGSSPDPQRGAVCRLTCTRGAGLIGAAPGRSLLKEWLVLWSRWPLLAHTQV